MSFPEKNAWACLVAVLVVYIPYFIFAFREPVISIVLFVAAVVFLAVLLALFHTVNALLTARIRKTGDTLPPDERDRYFDLKANKISGIVLGATVIIWCINAMMSYPIMGLRNVIAANSNGATTTDLASFTISAVDAIWWVQLLFAGFVLANVIYYLSLIVMYRRFG